MNEWEKTLKQPKAVRTRSSSMLNVDWSRMPDVLSWIEEKAEHHNVGKSEVVRAIILEAFKKDKGES